MTKHYQTAEKDKIPLSAKLIYGLGAFVNNLMAAAIGGMMIVLNLGLGMNPALVGLLGALPRLTDALTDPIVGYISDNTKSKWGRRKPYIFFGAIASGLIFIALWQFPPGQSESFYFVYFLVGSLIFYLAYTIFATPWVALGYELTPDYHERTRLMGVQNFIGQLAYVVAPWFLFIMQHKYFDSMMEGASVLATLIGITVIAIGILPALFLKERFDQINNSDETESKKTVMKRAVGELKKFFVGFALTLRFKPFLKLCIATFLVFNGFILISSFQSYVIIYYVMGGDIEAGSKLAGQAGSIGAVSTFVVIGIVTWLSTHLGKRHAFYIAIGISIIGYAAKWFCYNPDIPWLVLLPAPLMAFGLGGLFTLMPSMVADTVDYDELNTGQRREGMFGSIFWWVVKLGMAAAIAGGGFLLNATGFDIELKANQTAETLYLLRVYDVIIPVVASFIAIYMVYLYPVSEENAHEIREELEKRRDDKTLNLAPAAS